MANVDKEKRYGLITAKKPALSAPRPGNIFADNSDSDSDNGTDWVKKALKTTTEKGTVKKQTQLNMQKALKEDPTIYQYDEVYDEMERDKSELKEQKKEAKQSKYIQNLLKTAERRKIEQEHRIERMVQKEREAEGAMFADKESFVTSAYKAKLEEFKKLEEEELRMERLEAIADVTKQQDMTGFYRHLYRQKVEKRQLGEIEGEQEVKTEVKDNTILNVRDLDRDDVVSSDSESESERESEDEVKNREKRLVKNNKLKRMRNFRNKRQYRKRISESDSDASTGEEGYDGEEEEEKDDDDGQDNDNVGPGNKKSRIENIKNNYAELEKETNERLKAAEENLDKIIKRVAGAAADDEIETEEKPAVVEKKRSIWEKRCHGDLFEEAVRRYYERKTERMADNVVF